MSSDNEFITRAELNMRLDALVSKVGRWLVYMLHEVDREDEPFYIGLSVDPSQRIREHYYGRNSAAYEHMRALDAADRHCTYTTLATFDNYAEALMYEAVHIAIRPGLLNRDIEECRNKIDLPETIRALLGEALK